VHEQVPIPGAGNWEGTMALSGLGWRTSCAVIAMSVGMVSAQAAVAATIKGRVVDAASNRPLPGAAVKVVATGDAATTDANGLFTVDNIADGPQQITIDYVGYGTKTVDVVAGPDASPVQIALQGQSAGDIVVTGTRAAERAALQTKKAADNFVEALYANDVGKLPDQNVAEAVQRLPGLTVANDQGEGRYVIVRGIDPNLINVTLNGQTLPAPEPDGRQVKLDDIPSSLISAVVVTKSLTPDLDANAIGGSVDIRTVTAFDRNKKFFFDARGAIGRYDINHKKPYEVDAQIGGLFGADKQFGAVFSVNYSRRPIESQNFQASEAWVVPDASTGADQNYVVPDENGLRDYNLIRQRLGIVGNLDWAPSSDVHVYLHTSYSKYSDDENRDQNRLADEDNFRNQTATTGTFDAVGTILVRHREEDDNTKSATLGGEFNIGAGKLEASGGYTKAVKTDPLRSEFTFATNKGGAPKTPITVDYDLTTHPYTFDDRDNVFADASRFGISKFNTGHRRAYEELWQGRLDYSVPIANGSD
jgi:TonB-dependent receptor